MSRTQGLSFIQEEGQNCILYFKIYIKYIFKILNIFYILVDWVGLGRLINIMTRTQLDPL